MIGFLLFCVNGFGQDRKLRLPLWTTYSKHTDIVGVSVGVVPKNLTKDESLTRTFGLRIEAFPLSVFYFLAPRGPLSITEEEFVKTLKKDDLTEKIYGFNLASGSFENINVTGISVTGFIHYSKRHNGIAMAGLINQVESANGIVAALGGNGVFRGNGIMISSVWGNGAAYFNGLQISAENVIGTKGSGVQIGLFNSAKNFKGLQFGLWNKNDKRSLPILNWQFKS